MPDAPVGIVDTSETTPGDVDSEAESDSDGGVDSDANGDMAEAEVASPVTYAEITGATVMLGCNAVLDSLCAADELLAHAVTLSSYAIDLREVRRDDYQACVDAAACGSAETGGPAFPVVNMLWAAAVAYCGWRDGSRLCTEAEWEYAARGDGLATWPWGEQAPSCALASFGTCGGLQPVDSLPAGASPFGCEHMAGNAMEWVADYYGTYSATASVDPTGPQTGAERVVRGGTALDEGQHIRASRRAKVGSASTSLLAGFRCCWSL